MRVIGVCMVQQHRFNPLFDKIVICLFRKGPEKERAKEGDNAIVL